MKHTHRRFPLDADYGGYTGAFGDPRNDDAPYVECPCCDARGWVRKLDERNKPFTDLCEACEGMKFLDAETGEPYDRDALAKLAEGD